MTSLTYTSAMPKDGNSSTMPLTPSTTALQVTNNGSLSSHVEVTFNTSTTLIEVSALSQGIYLKWGTGTAVTSSNFDEYIQSGTTRHYKVPTSLTTGALYTGVSVLQQAASATLIMIEK